MSKQFIKGVSIENESAAIGDTDPSPIEEYETNEEETNTLIRSREEDFIQGLIKAAEFASEEKQRIEIIRDKRLFFAFHIRPLSSEEYETCRKKYTKYMRNKQLGMKIAEETDRIKYQSAIIYQATIPQDREKLWDNRKVWDALNAKQDRIMNGLDVIEYTLKAGEKDRILEAIDRLSGYESNLEEVAKN